MAIRNWKVKVDNTGNLNQEGETIDIPGEGYGRVIKSWEHETGLETVDVAKGQDYYYVFQKSVDTDLTSEIAMAESSLEEAKTRAGNWMRDHPFGSDDRTLEGYGHYRNDEGEIVQYYPKVYVEDRKGDKEPSESRYALTVIYENGKVETWDWADDSEGLTKLKDKRDEALKDKDIDNGGFRN